jgi:hypothetical protein
VQIAWLLLTYIFVDADAPALCFALCQVLAGRSDVMPDIWIDNLRTLEDSVPPIPVAQVCFALANSLNTFQLAECSAVSISKTHRKTWVARLHCTCVHSRPCMICIAEQNMVYNCSATDAAAVFCNSGCHALSQQQLAPAASSASWQSPTLALVLIKLSACCCCCAAVLLYSGGVNSVRIYGHRSAVRCLLRV